MRWRLLHLLAVLSSSFVLALPRAKRFIVYFRGIFKIVLISVVLSLILLPTSHSPSPEGGLASEGFFRCPSASLGGCLHLLLPQPLPDPSEPVLCWKHACVAAVLSQGHSFYHWHLLALPAAQLLLRMAKMSTQNCCPCWKARLWQASPIFDFSNLLRDCNIVSILRWKSSPSFFLFPQSWILLDFFFSLSMSLLPIALFLCSCILLRGRPFVAQSLISMRQCKGRIEFPCIFKHYKINPVSF